jgi:hypothetical protein
MQLLPTAHGQLREHQIIPQSADFKIAYMVASDCIINPGTCITGRLWNYFDVFSYFRICQSTIRPLILLSQII